MPATGYNHGSGKYALRGENSKSLRAIIPVCAAIAGGYLCFKLFYIVGVAWERHRFGDANLAGLMEVIFGIPVGIVCGFVILIAMRIWMEPEGQRSIELRGLLAAALGLLAALMSFILVENACGSHYYGKGGGNGVCLLAWLVVSAVAAVLVSWFARERLKRSTQA